MGFPAHASDLPRKLADGKLAATQAASAPQLIFNDWLDAALTLLFLTVTWVLVLDTLRVIFNILVGKPHPPCTESPHEPQPAGRGLGEGLSLDVETGMTASCRA